MSPEEKREMIEISTGKIITGKDEITINPGYSPSYIDLANRWRKGRDLCPKSPFFETNLLTFLNNSSIIPHYTRTTLPLDFTDKFTDTSEGKIALACGPSGLGLTVQAEAGIERIPPTTNHSKSTVYVIADILVLMRLR